MPEKTTTGQKGPRESQPCGTRQKTRSQLMPRFKYVYWCISHQQYVAPKARRGLRDQQSCEIVRLNLTLLRQVDFHKFSTWISSQRLSRKPANTSPRPTT